MNYRLNIAMESIDLPQVDWGSKHICQDCEAKYYDMGRSPIVCPSCGALLVVKPVLTRGSSSSVQNIVPKKEKKPEPVEESGSLETKAEEDLLANEADLADIDEEAVESEDDSSPAEIDVDEDTDLSSVIDETKTKSEI